MAPVRSRLIRTLSSLLGRLDRLPIARVRAHPARAPEPRFPGAPNPPAHESPRPAPSAFDAALAGAIAGRSRIVAGSLELLGFEDIRTALGDQWEAVSRRVIDIAAREIRLCLDPADLVRPFGDAGFLIHFDSLDKAAAEAKARLMALRVKARLIDQVPEVAGALAVEHFVCDLDPDTIRGEGESLADALYRRLTRMRRDAERMARQDRRALIRDLQILYSPVWHVERQVTLLNRCLLDANAGGPSLSQIMALAESQELDAIQAEVDYMRLTKALESLHRMIPVGRTAMLVVPVSFGTIHSETMVAGYLRLLDAAPATYRRYLVLEITGVMAGDPARRLRQLASLLERYVKYVAIDLAIDDPRLPAVAGLGLWAVSLNLSWANSTDPWLDGLLRRFVAAAGPVGTLAYGASSIGLALAASKAGFTYIDGTGIHLPVKEPRPPLRLLPLPRRPRLGSRRSGRRFAPLPDPFRAEN